MNEEESRKLQNRIERVNAQRDEAANAIMEFCKEHGEPPPPDTSMGPMVAAVLSASLCTGLNIRQSIQIFDAIACRWASMSLRGYAQNTFQLVSETWDIMNAASKKGGDREQHDNRN